MEYGMIDWKKGLEMALNYWMKRPWKALKILGLLMQEPWSMARPGGACCLCWG